jgi:hypothetical protein
MSIYSRKYTTADFDEVKPPLIILLTYRQVQDLERKLRNAKLEVSNLQSQMQRQRLAALDESEWTDTTWQRNPNESDIRESMRGFDFRRVREEIILRSPGLFHIPPAWRESVPDPVGELDVGVSNYKDNFNPTLPARPFVNHLLELFRTEVFTISPYLDFQAFVDRVNELYGSENEPENSRIPSYASRSWLVVFYATLALTAQYIQDDLILQHYSAQSESEIRIGWDLADTAVFFFGPATKKTTLDDIRGALMLAVYYKQLNELGAANVWLGVACKNAQYLGTTFLCNANNIGCHRFSPGLNREEETARANVWWDIYVFDRYSFFSFSYLTSRILAGQQGCEMTITESDCDLRPPDLVPSTSPEIQARVELQSKLYNWTTLHSRILRILRDSPFLSEEEVEKLDERIQAQYEKMPKAVSHSADSTFSPGWYLDAHIFVDNTKLRVFRHNLTLNAPFASRLAAVRRCIEMAKEASPRIAEKFIDPDRSTLSPEEAQEAQEHNQRVFRIVYPEHCQYLYSCAMYLIVAKFWSLALPFVIGLRVIGDKLAINKCCCRYLCGVISFTEGKDSIITPQRDSPNMEEFWSEEEEEVLALIAADMHQDVRAWEAVWQKDEDLKPRSLDVSPIQEETEIELRDDSPSVSETSDLRSISKASEGEMLSVPSAYEPRPPFPRRWSHEEETWDSMIVYIRAKCEEEQNQMEDVRLTEENVNIGGISGGVQKGTMYESTKDAIQQRMSISNLL